LSSSLDGRDAARPGRTAASGALPAHGTTEGPRHWHSQPAAPASTEQTVTWYAFRIDATHYGIFDTFASENGRQAHIAGPVAEALGKAAGELLAGDPSISPVDVVAVK